VSGIARRIALCVGLVPALLLPAAMAGAEDAGVQAFHDWALRCPTGAGCSLEQRI
jgi:hypothetical protein